MSTFELKQQENVLYDNYSVIYMLKPSNISVILVTADENWDPNV